MKEFNYTRLLASLGLCALCLGALSSCASKKVQPVDTSYVKDVGVVSGCAQGITRESYGLFNVGDDDITRGDVLDWRLDDVITASVIKKLPSSITSSPTDFDFSQLDSVAGAPPVPFTSRIQQALRGAPTLHDYYLIVLEADMADRSYLVENIKGAGVLAFTGTMNRRSGIGLFSRGRNQFTHVTCRVILYNRVKNTVIISRVFNKTGPMDDDLRVNKWVEYDDGQKARIREIVTPLLESSVNDMMDELKLGAPMQPVVSSNGPG